MFKTFFKVGIGTLVLGGAALGGALMIAGPQRTHAVIDQVHTGLLERIDENIDDPSKMRSQLRRLEAEYPERIGQVRGDLAELRQQIRQLEREQAISERVVEMAQADFESLEPVMNQATAQRTANGAEAVQVVAWDDKVYSYNRAETQLRQVRETVLNYTERVSDAKHDLAYLYQQEGRLEELLTNLEGERAQFQTQLRQLNRQVDAIARNERLIDLMEDRNKTIEECSNYEAASLDNLTLHLSQVRERQQAELDVLAGTQHRMDYEDMARMELSQGFGQPKLEPIPLQTASE